MVCLNGEILKDLVVEVDAVDLKVPDTSLTPPGKS